MGQGSTAGTSITSREFNQSTGEAKHAARKGPVFVTNRGQPTHVLLTYADYRGLTQGNPSLVDLLCATPNVGEIDLPLPRQADLPRPVHLD